MTSVLWRFPEPAHYGRVVPKRAIYEHGKPDAALRKKFAEQIGQIRWQYKLSPETTNLPARGPLQEIEVFDLDLKTSELDEDLLRCIDRAIPRPIIYRLQHAQRICIKAAYKRPSEADSNRWVTGRYFASPWLAAGTALQPLPVALDLQGLYEQLFRSLLPYSARPDESLGEQLQRIEHAQSLQSHASRLEARMAREKQFNRKVALNAELRELQHQLARLSASAPAQQ